MIVNIDGSIFNTDTKIIAHQVNCQGVMHKGIANSFRFRYPSMFEQYREHCFLLPHSRRKELLGKVLIYKTPEGQYIANCFAQNQYGGGSTARTDYEAFKSCFLRLKNFAMQNEIDAIAVPYKIGCGLGGGDWRKVMDIFTDLFADSEITLEIYRYEQN